MAKYKTSKGYHLRLDAELIESPAYRDLKSVARALLIEFANLYRPSRNGRLSISVRNAATLIRCNKTTAEKAFHELASHGFIRVTNMDQWQDKKAREWAVTWQSVGNREPTNEWKAWVEGANMCPLPLRQIKRPRPQNRTGCPKSGYRINIDMGQQYAAGG